MNISDKIKRCRELKKLSQYDLAKLTGLSQRTIASYESQNVIPRASNIVKLSNALGVSVDYLTNDNLSDPQHGADMKEFVDSAKARLGAEAGEEVEALLNKTVALFAGGELSDEARDDYFSAVLHAYQIGKAEARRRKMEAESNPKN